MRCRHVICSGALSLGLVLAVPSQAALAASAVPITKLQSRHLPPRVVTRRVLDQLAHVLHLQPYLATGRRPLRPLSDLWFWTAPYATDVPGLCAADEITVNFRQAGGRLKGADTKMTARGITARTAYHFVRPPSTPFLEGMDWPAVTAADRDCATLDPSRDMRLSVSDETDAVEAVWLVQEIVRLARQPSFAAMLDCSNYPSGPDASCAEMLDGLEPAASSFGRPCILPPVGDSATQCMDIYVDKEGWSVGLRVSFKSDGKTQTIMRIAPSVVVTTADERAD